MGIEKLIRPKSIAVIGVTDRPGSFGMTAAVNVLKSKNTDHIYYVHPKRTELFERKCYPSMAELPEVPECVVICTPIKTVNGILRQAGELGVKGAVVFASGYSEEQTAEGILLEEELVEIGNHFGMKILGPNCMGLNNLIDGVNMWSLGWPDQIISKGAGVGFVGQSGAITATTVHTGYINVAYAISSGNGNSTTLEEFAEFLVDDPHVSVVSLYLEGVKNAERFARTLKKAAEKRKPVVILKGGRSKIGASSAASHTGNLAGSKEAYDAVFRKFGVIQVEDLEQFICMSQTLSVLRGHLPEKPTYAGINLSGGENTLFADVADKYQLELPELSDQTKSAMREYLPGFATPKNPLDATTALFRNEEKVIGLLMTLEREANIGSVILGGNLGMRLIDVWQIFCQSIVNAQKRGFTKPAFYVPAYEGTRHPEYRKILENAGVPLMSAVSTSMQCLNKLADFVKYKPAKKILEIAGPAPDSLSNDSFALSEFESKNELAAINLPIPLQKLVNHGDDLPGALEGMGYPLVLKACSPDILHKSDIGAVKLNIGDADQAVSAYAQIMSSVAEHAPDAALEGILVQEMVPQGVEMILGITSDVQFGPMVMVGLGGVFVEVFRDVALSPVPICKAEALDMIQGLRGSKLLSGYRGQVPCDVDAFADLMVAVSDYAVKNKKTLKEMDLNPVFVYPEGQGVCIGDALIVKRSV